MSKISIFTVTCILFILSSGLVNALSLVQAPIAIRFGDIESCGKFLDFLDHKNVSYGYERDWIHKYGCDDTGYVLFGRPLSSFEYGDTNYESTAFDTSKHSEFFDFMGYSNEDVEAISDLFSKLKLKGNSGIITKHSEERYREFQQQINDINNDVCDCSQITIEARTNDWTAYQGSFKESCSFSTGGIHPPIYCANNPLFIPILVFLFIIVGVVGLTVFIIKKHKK
jgi:hypothetical protein